jgi:hypothetical protein
MNTDNSTKSNEYTRLQLELLYFGPSDREAAMKNDSVDSNNDTMLPTFATATGTTRAGGQQPSTTKNRSTVVDAASPRGSSTHAERPQKPGQVMKELRSAQPSLLRNNAAGSSSNQMPAKPADLNDIQRTKSEAKTQTCVK